MLCNSEAQVGVVEVDPFICSRAIECHVLHSCHAWLAHLMSRTHNFPVGKLT
jgi:hypothetical protein